MNRLPRISSIVLVFFVYSLFGMDVKLQQINSLQSFAQIYKRMLPGGKLFCSRNDLEKTGKCFDDVAKKGKFSARDMLTDENMYKKFIEMNSYMTTARKFSTLHDLTFDHASDKKVEAVKYALALQKMLIQIYLQQFADLTCNGDNANNPYYKAYKEAIEKIMHITSHSHVKRVCTLFDFSFCEYNEMGLFVFQAKFDPFQDFSSPAKNVFKGIYSFYKLYDGLIQDLITGDNEIEFKYLLKNDPFKCNNKLVYKEDGEPEGPIIETIWACLSETNWSKQKIGNYTAVCQKYCKAREEIEAIGTDSISFVRY